MASFEYFWINLKKKYSNNEDWYIYNLCVSKEAQGKKIASKLMKHFLITFKPFGITNS